MYKSPDHIGNADAHEAKRYEALDEYHRLCEEQEEECRPVFRKIAFHEDLKGWWCVMQDGKLLAVLPDFEEAEQEGEAMLGKWTPFAMFEI